MRKTYLYIVFIKHYVRESQFTNFLTSPPSLTTVWAANTLDFVAWSADGYRIVQLSLSAVDCLMRASDDHSITVVISLIVSINESSAIGGEVRARKRDSKEHVGLSFLHDVRWALKQKQDVVTFHK